MQTLLDLNIPSLNKGFTSVFNSQFQEALSNLDFDWAKKILSNSYSLVDPSENNNFAIRIACSNGQIEFVQKLLNHPKVDPSDLDNEAIISASKNGHLEVVRLLLKNEKVNPAAQNNKAIKKARLNGHTAVAFELLKDFRVSIRYLSWRIALISVKIILGQALLSHLFPKLHLIASFCISTALSIGVYALSSKACRVAKLKFIL